MHDPWIGRVRLCQTSPFSPADRCDLAFVKAQGLVLVALVVDGAPGRASARPPWPRETLFDAVGEVFLEHIEPDEMIRALGDRLRTFALGHAWRLLGAAVALRWDAGSGAVAVAEAGDTKAWLIGAPAPTPLIEAGIPQIGIAPRNMLGSATSDIRSAQIKMIATVREASRSLALITDGAYAMLKTPSGALPADPSAWAIDTVGADDATVLLIQPPK